MSRAVAIWAALALWLAGCGLYGPPRRTPRAPQPPAVTSPARAPAGLPAAHPAPAEAAAPAENCEDPEVEGRRSGKTGANSDPDE